ncbi:MAG: hypothetical protein ACRCZB_05095 [Bacteroidales bacterium]
MPRQVEIVSCVECPSCSYLENNAPFCSLTKKSIETSVLTEIPESCSLLKVGGSSEKKHEEFIKSLYKRIQTTGLNPDSIHDACVQFDNYIKTI